MVLIPENLVRFETLELQTLLNTNLNSIISEYLTKKEAEALAVTPKKRGRPSNAEKVAKAKTEKTEAGAGTRRGRPQGRWRCWHTGTGGRCPAPGHRAGKPASFPRR